MNEIVKEMFYESIQPVAGDSGMLGYNYNKPLSDSDYILEYIPSSPLSEKWNSYYLKWEDLAFNVPKAMSNYLEYRRDLTNELYEYVKKIEDSNKKSWWEHIENWVLSKKEWEWIGTFNTTQDDNLNSDILQYAQVYDEYNQEINIIQSHNGADYRTGYSSPRVFEGEIYQCFKYLSEVEGLEEDETLEALRKECKELVECGENSSEFLDLNQMWEFYTFNVLPTIKEE